MQDKAMSATLDKQYSYLKDLRQKTAHLRARFEEGSDVRNALIGAASASRDFLQMVVELHCSVPLPEEKDRWLGELRRHGVLDPRMATKLQTILILGGHASSGNHGVPLTREDGKTVLSLLDEVLEWYFCDSEIGPQLESLDSEKPDPEAELFRETLELVSSNSQFTKPHVWGSLDESLVAAVEAALSQARELKCPPPAETPPPTKKASLPWLREDW